MARAIGIDIGTRTVKAVELSGSSKSFKIQRVAIREIPEEEAEPLATLDDEGVDAPPSRDERIAAIVGEIFKTLALPKEDACASFPAGKSMIREITVPFFDDDQIRKIVKFEAENHLHSHAIDDVVINWIKTGETKDGSRLTVFASPKDDLAERIAIMRRVAVDPATVDLDATALYTALDGSGVFVDNPNAIVLDLGAASTNLMLIVEGRPRVFRSFVLGINTLEAAIGQELGVPIEQGRNKLMGGGGPHPDDLFVPAEPAGEGDKSLTQIHTDVVSERRSGFVKKLHREAIRSLMAVRTEAPPEVILLTGGGSLVPGVSKELEDQFGLPVQPVDLVHQIGAKDAGSDPAYAGAALGPAIGCALRMMGRNPLDIELLQDEFAPRNTFDVVRVALATGLTLIFVALAIITYATKRELQAEQIKYGEKYAVARRLFLPVENAYRQSVDKKTKEGAQQAAVKYLRSLPSDSTQIRKLRRKLQRRYEYLESELGLSKNIPQLPSAVKVWYETYKALHTVDREKGELGNWFQIEKIVINPRSMRITLLVDRANQIETARTLIAKSKYFRERAKNRSNVVEEGASVKTRGRVKGDLTINFRDED